MDWTRPKIPQIKDVLPLTNGIFGHCNYSFKYDISKAHLDFLLLAKIGQRSPAPVIDVIHEQNDEEYDAELTNAELTTLADIMVMTYKQKWDKLGEIYDIEYDPIHNYLDAWEDQSDGSSERERTETVDRVDTLGTTVNKSSTRTDNLQEVSGKTGTDTQTRTDNTMSTETRNLTNGNTRTLNTDEANTGTVGVAGNNTDTNSIWGFNSSTDVNSDKTAGTNSSTETRNTHTADTGTITDQGTEGGSKSVADTGTVTTAMQHGQTTTTNNTGTQGVTGSEATTGTNRRDLDTTEGETTEDSRARSGQHTGNIGNLTSQKQILEEIELWKWNYVEQILDDAKEFLSLPIYLC